MKGNRLTRRFFFVATLCLALGGAFVLAQAAQQKAKGPSEKFPSKAVRLVIPINPAASRIGRPG